MTKDLYNLQLFYILGRMHAAGVVSAMDMMRIPLATVLFVGSVGLLWTMLNPEDFQFFAGLDSITSNVIAAACIVCLVYSFVLYSNIKLAPK
jgi:ABC-type enterochelin transport system permease subunit